MSGLAERLFNIMAHYRAALVFERWICAAVPIMPHYVNIAWEDYFLAVSFCLQGRCGSLTRRRSGQCAVCGRDKKHDKK